MGVAGALSAAVIAIAGIGIVMTHKTVTVNYDGASKKISTWDSSPSQVVAQANLALHPHDKIVTANDHAVADGETITIKRAHRITAIENGKQVERWTTADSTHSIVAAANAPMAVPVAPVDERELPVVDKEQSLTVFHDGETTAVNITPGQSVRTAIEDSGIKVSPLDRIVVMNGAQAKLGASAPTVSDNKDVLVNVTRVSRDVEEDKIVTEKEVTEKDDDSLYKGEKKVVEEGQDGVRIKRTLVEKVEGDVVYSTLLTDETVSTMKPEVVAIGTKERPARGGGSSGGGSAAHYSGDGVWGALAQCESGGNPRSVGGGGLYHGLYQFSPSTWRSVGGTGLPSQASPEEQTKRAKMLQQRSGWGQWPVCSRKIGAR